MLYIAFGKNVGESPMPVSSFIEFAEAVENVVITYEGLTYADTWAEGQSRYGEMREETGVFVWFDKSDDLREITVKALGDVARKFGQESIAWSVAGETRFTEGV